MSTNTLAPLTALRFWTWVFKAAAQYTVVILAALYGVFFESNMFTLFVCIVGGAWVAFANHTERCVALFDLSWKSRYSRHTYFPNALSYWLVVGWVIVAVVASNWLYLPFPAGDYVAVDRGKGRVDYYEKWFITTINPLTTTARYFSASQSVWFFEGRGSKYSCRARTLDGKGVEGNVGAQLWLSFDNLPTAYARAGSDRNLGILVKGELCSRFAATMSQYTLATIPNLLSLEYKTAEEKTGMNSLGVQYSGLMYVGYLHAYVAQ